ncbi:hypothetical protein H0266_18500 [Halobacillus locisalis]|uniref:Uncharacterized protein n=1 Tax=Halobacillus locisalis TaxID=220753 RepID=A0A838CY92_9BACI|nr:hypothetical protein [Halobacillus locisalis]MBA2176874.1 hypothetical protein [Halobacillus locisalis]
MGDFFQTRRGVTFYEYHVPEMMKSLQKIGSELERQNNLKEEELKMKRGESNEYFTSPKV